MEREPTCFINSFAPEPPEQIQIRSTACDIISLNGQGRLCLVTCGGWRDFSNYAKMSTILWRRPEKKDKKNMERGSRKQFTFGDASTGFSPNNFWDVTTKTWVVLLIGWIKFHTWHDQSEAYPDLDSDVSPVWNFCARFSGLIWRRNQL